MRSARSSPPPRFAIERGRLLVVVLAIVLGHASASHARTIVPATMDQLASSAARVFRGRCTSAETGTLVVAGARVPATVYSFEVTEHLKGEGPRRITFRQVGTPAGGPRDLGTLAGLPVYAPGTEYVLFLLPESRAGLTSPAGAAEGAFLLRGNRAIPWRHRGRDGRGVGPMSYDALRETVRGQTRP